MTTDKPARTLTLKPGAASKPSDPFAPRRAPVRPPGPARAQSVSASAPKPPRSATERGDGPRGAPTPDGRERRWEERPDNRPDNRPTNRPDNRLDNRQAPRQDSRQDPRGRAEQPNAYGRTPAAPRGDERGWSERPQPSDRPRRSEPYGNPRDPRDAPGSGDRSQRGPSGAPRPPPPHRPDLARVGNVRGEIRLNKRMADLGLCSRREADEWIARGWVLVNGEPAVMGMPVAPDAQVDVLPQARHQQAGQVTILLHKPMGYVSGQPEDGHEAAATLIGAPSQWRGDARHPADNRRFAPEHTRGLAPCGRLDIDSVGLLVLTQDGRIARQLIGESSGIEKEYLVRVHYAPNGPHGAGVVTQDVQAVFPAAQLARLRHGLSLDDQPLKPAQVDWMNPEQLRFILTEGKKRQIRRMCEQVGLHVVGLKRIRIGNVVLGNLPVGLWRYLGAGESFA
ncbi:MAG: pseudouridine synthase [Hydrogenophaga sp.]|uniref:pseudouridine synthase n=1 Tax=Hydrogenophaga sp. TaxID=1904254 RepID=UPI002720B2FC|nr:pseudouridine synthase [Hydrogenophaga sp.]MDO9482774.1 pseudouridine synthase [Hydrogenophaga sp.]MDP3345121.1 pseudouridine synthase [Hydrogenophaga sp.]MDP3806068.1 pseudouridine synthase [Hydrogenophaga sp.]